MALIMGQCCWTRPWSPVVLMLPVVCVSQPGMDGNASARGTEGQHSDPRQKVVSLSGATGYLLRGNVGAAAEDLLCGQ